MNAITEWISLHEADLTFADRTDRVRDELREVLGGDWADRYLWIRDISDTWAVYEDSGETNTPGLFRVGYSIDDAGNCTIIGPAVAVEPVTTYTPAPEEPSPTPLIIEPDEAERELVGDTIALVEAVVRRDGTVPIKIIQPGWGTSGYYSADVIKESGPAAFPAGTHMFWDHPAASEEADRPERSLRDLSAVLAGDAYWQESGVAGPGLYGDAKVFADYQPALEELAPHIGVSIRATGRAHLGEAEGERGLLVDEIVAAKSVDFVTAAGAGGEILSLFEAVRGHKPTKTKEQDMATDAELREARQAHQDATQKLQEATQLGALAAADRDRLLQENARHAEGEILREACAAVTKTLGDAKYAPMPDMTKTRLIESVSANPPVKDGKLDTVVLATRFEEAVKAELEYVAQITGKGDGTVEGLGLSESAAGGDVVDDKVLAGLEESFADLGLSEAGAKAAVAGRK